MKEVFAKSYTLLSVPGSEDRRTVVRDGLVVRRVGPNRFRVRREDGEKFEKVLYATCSVVVPWMSEFTECEINRCHKHGRGCGGRKKNCLVRAVVADVPTWFVRMVFSKDMSSADVFVFRQGELETTPDPGAGFAVCVVLRAGERS